jgi:hypothetical protein
MPVNPDEQVEYNGVLMAIKDVPNLAVRQLLGVGHYRDGRPLVPGNWPFTPETCIYTEPGDAFVWINDGETLVCPGCGVDGT